MYRYKTFDQHDAFVFISRADCESCVVVNSYNIA